jgi:hypothetical protein
MEMEIEEVYFWAEKLSARLKKEEAAARRQNNKR